MGRRGFKCCFQRLSLYNGQIYKEFSLQVRDAVYKESKYKLASVILSCGGRPCSSTNDLDWVLLQPESEDAREVEYQSTDEVAQVQFQRDQQPQARREQRSSQYKELASAFYTLNSKYRISWECAELLIELAGGGGGVSTTKSWGVGSAPPLFLMRTSTWVVRVLPIGGREEEEQGKSNHACGG